MFKSAVTAPIINIVEAKAPPVDPSVAFAARLPKSVGLTQITDRDPQSLSPLERKQEFYGVLRNIAVPSYLSEISAIRENFPHGLVRLDSNRAPQSSVDTQFIESIKAAKAVGNSLEVANILYRTMRQTLDVAGERWHDTMMASGSAALSRLLELSEAQMLAKYGDRPVAKRIASATAQTVSVSFGIQELATRLYRSEFLREAEPEQILQAHRSGLRIAMVWANFNRFELLSLEKKIRTLRDDHHEIEPLHAVDSFKIEADGTVRFVGEDVLRAIDAENIDVSEGTFGCPGKMQIPILWKWAEEVSISFGLAGW